MRQLMSEATYIQVDYNVEYLVLTPEIVIGQ